MATRARQSKNEGIQVAIKIGGKTVMATFAEFHLSVVQGLEVGKTSTGESKSIEKITGMNKSTDVTLKRGVIQAKGFSDWLDDVRSGKSKNRKVVVTVPMKGPGKSALRWKLGEVQITKLDAPDLNAKGNSVAIEELVLSAEKVELEPTPR
jgi:phage tail-like protein